MPQNVRNWTLDLDELPENECKHIPLSCSWTTTSKDESLTVIKTCWKWTFDYDFCVRVTAHPQVAPNVSKQIDVDDHHPLLRSLTEVLSLYEAFPETHLNTHQLNILEVIIDYLHLKLYWHIMAHTHLAYPDLALDKFCGTDPDQDAESLFQLIERKIIFTFGDAPADPDEFADYTLKKKALFSFLIRGPAD